MIQLILFLGVGVLLFLSLFLLMRQKPRAEGGAEELCDAREALDSIQVDLLPPSLVRRIFAQEDLEFVSFEAPEKVRELFLADRKRIAIAWAEGLRHQVTNLQRFHRGSARHYAQLSFRAEIELAADFALLRAACRMLELTLRARGPYGAATMVSATTSIATRICSVSEKSLAFLRAPVVGPSAHPPTGHESVS